MNPTLHYTRFFLFSFIIFLFAGVQLKAQRNADGFSKYVNPFIGTGGHGHTFPGPTMPFGGCQVGPDTRLEGWDGCSGYHYSDSVIFGFSHTHLSGTGCSDYGDILLMPVTQNMNLDNYQYASRFSHTKEWAQAGYYRVKLEQTGIDVELTPTLHGAMHRYHYPMGADMYVVLDLKHRDQVLDCKMEKVDDYTIRGYRFSKAWAQNQKVFFEIRFSQPIEGIIYDAAPTGSQTTFIQTEKSKHCIIQFENPLKYQSSSLPTLLAKVAISGVDEEGAHLNLSEEMPDWEFDKYHQRATAEWDKELAKISVQDEPGSNAKAMKEKLTIFYTALYHCMIHPSIYNDVDGRYRGRDDRIHQTKGKFNYYTVFSLWDTYRALHPLLTLIDKKRTNDFINTFIKQYEQGGRLPIWELSSNETNCMIGYHVVSVIWDAYNKGIDDFDVEKAYEAMTSIATHASDYDTLQKNKQIEPQSANTGILPEDIVLKEEARAGAADADALESYCRYGYVRSDDSHESVSKTLEYAYNDWCIAQMAKALGKNEDYLYYRTRSLNWRNVYDPVSGFMRARKNACLYAPFSPYTVDNNYTEANSWQYSFYVPHDEEIFRQFATKMPFDSLYQQLLSAKTQTEGREQADITGLIGQYAHGNEPSHHILYMKNQLQPDNAEIEKVKREFYANDPDGLIGNEDCGQMSAWFVMSSLGLYQVCPGRNVFAKTDPDFSSIEMHDDAGHEWHIQSSGVHQGKAQALDWQGNIDQVGRQDTVTQYFYRTFPAKVKAARETQHDWDEMHDMPPANPFITNAKRNFKDAVQVEIQMIANYAQGSHIESATEIVYSLNDADYTQYTEPLHLSENATIRFYTRKKGKYSTRSPIQVATFTKIPSDRHIILHNQFNPSYSAGGADGLMDGIFGKLNWRAGDWQGYQGQDVEVVMAFDEPRKINSVAANFLEDQNSWIFYPKEVSFYISNDSLHWTLLEDIPTHKSDHAEQTTITLFSTTKVDQSKVKYVKMRAKNFGPMPQWHEGRGNPTFIFLDEFEVK